MTAAISATSTASITDSIFTKLDTKQKGYIDAADMKAAAGTDEAAASKAAEAFKQIDTDSDGKVTKSELSVAVDKVAGQLNAQLDQSRTAAAGGDAKSGGAGHAGGGRGGAQAASSSDALTAEKYVAAADTNLDGTVSAEEQADYDKLQAAAATKAQAQVQQYTNNSGESKTQTAAAVDVSA